MSQIFSDNLEFNDKQLNKYSNINRVILADSKGRELLILNNDLRRKEKKQLVTDDWIKFKEIK